MKSEDLYVSEASPPPQNTEDEKPREYMYFEESKIKLENNGRWILENSMEKGWMHLDMRAFESLGEILSDQSAYDSSQITADHANLMD